MYNHANYQVGGADDIFAHAQTLIFLSAIKARWVSISIIDS